ncbi:pilus assembly protein PilP [Noviherbaspirillum galbum]|uniref:Pilus assembly protein PilP n=1 Tax=Noviherbaspirillum galbum TaxID=2709383 RepID=A0A6B3SKU1_9BURK|nr:pilus assembly protein PilP [Noviherbaspirillum galbum]NEX61464.1 pilus assembly protein PilP [Noviherbaspirillum galbum]
MLAALLAPVLLAGCGDSGMHDLQKWTEDERGKTPVTVEKLPEPKKFTPFVYAAKNEVDPFNAMKLSVALARAQANMPGKLKPDLDRRKEPLEAFPLDSIRMVGTLQKPGLSYALLQIDKSVYQVKVGNYIGQNFGMVTRISESEVEVKEIVRDASGEWVERPAKLELQENKK